MTHPRRTTRHRRTCAECVTDEILRPFERELRECASDAQELREGPQPLDEGDRRDLDWLSRRAAAIAGALRILGRVL